MSTGVVRRRSLLSAVGTVGAAGLAGCLAGRSSGVVERSLVVGGRERTYHLHVPATVPRPAPLVLWLHGGPGNGRRLARHVEAVPVADREGFVACFPDGADGWNDGREFHPPDGDLEFLRTLVDSLVEDGLAAPDRTFVAGVSNGGMMAQRLAIDAPGLVTGVASVVGLLPARLPTPSRPVPVLLVAATEDPLMPFEGGGVGFDGDRGQVRSFAATVARWRSANGCTGDPRVEYLPDRADDGTRVRSERHDCPVPLAAYVVEGGGHGWPGAGGELRDAATGPATRDVDGTELCWRFFDAV